jgi:tetratricopeptide (TPR) repeat protein
MEASDEPRHSPPSKVMERAQMADESSNWNNYWNSVDVPGSPLLSRLFDALKIESESTIPAIDLDIILSSTVEADLGQSTLVEASLDEGDDLSIGSSSMDLVRYSHEVFQESRAFPTDCDAGLTAISFSEWSFREWDFSKGQPVKASISQIIGLSPFPVPPLDTQQSPSWHTRWSPHARAHKFLFEETKSKSRLYQIKRIFGANDPRTLRAMVHLSAIYNMRGKSRQAERLCRQVAIAYQETLGLKHINTLSAYLNVVHVLRNQRKLVSAYNIHQRIHSIIIGLFDRDHELALESNSIRTRMLYDSGQLDEADELIRQTFQIELYTLGPRHSRTLDDMRVLAETLRYRGRFVESEQLLRFSLSFYRPRNGTLPMTFFKNMERLAVVLQDQERHDECRNLALITAKLLDNEENDGPHDASFSLYQIAACTRMLGDLSESERQLRSVVERCGEENVWTFIYLQELAGVLKDMGRYGEAAPLLEKCYKVYLDMHGECHPYTIGCCQELSVIYEELGRYDNAIPFLQKELHYRRIQGRQNTPYFLNCLSKLARMLRKTGHYSDAARLYEECLHGFIELYGLLPTDYSVSQAIEGLSICYEELGRDEDAVALLRRHVDDARKNGYKPNSTMPWLIAKLARSLLKANRLYEAVTVYEECFPDIADIYGLTNDPTITVLEEMMICNCKIGRYEECLALLRQVSDRIRSSKGDQHPTLIDISEWMVEVRATLAAGDENVNKNQGDSHFNEPATGENMTVDEVAVSMNGKLAENGDPQAGEDWMGELIDFNLTEDPLST